MKKALIIGASSGIGLALTKAMLQRNYRALGCGRNEQALAQIKTEFPDSFDYQILDIRETLTLDQNLEQAVSKLDGMDICVISSGVSIRNPELNWEIEKNVVETNVVGFSQAAIFAANYFRNQKSGHLVGISSVAKYFGNPNPAYNASKAFEAIYLDGLRLRLERRGIYVTTVLPGFVETPMTEDQPRRFWSANAGVAAKQMLRAIENKKRYIFVTRRWRLFSWILPPLPFSLLRRIL